MKYKNFYKILLIILLSLTISNITLADNINQGGEDQFGMWDDNWHNAIVNYNIAKISLYDLNENKVIDSMIFSDKDISNYRIMDILSKPDYIKQNKSITQSQNYSLLKNSDGFVYVGNQYKKIDLPEMIIRGAIYKDKLANGIKDYFSNNDNLDKIVNYLIKSEEQHTKFNNKEAVLLVEPMVEIMGSCAYEEENYYNELFHILFTTTEIGLLEYNKHPFLRENTILLENKYISLRDYYEELLFKTLPFSTFKVSEEKIKSIKPYNTSNYDGWCTDDDDYLDMINCLGCFEVYSQATATNENENISTEPKEIDLEYYTNSWVITSVNVSSSRGFPYQSDRPGWAENTNGAKNNCLNGNGLAKITYKFESDEELDTKSYTQSIAIPENGSALSWVKWKCPPEPCYIDLEITTNSSDAVPDTNIIHIEVVDKITGKYPPNAEATDRNDDFTAPTIADGSWNTESQTSLEWTTYNYSWHYLWVWGCSRTREDGHLTEYGYSRDWDEDYVCEKHECPANSENHTCPTGRCHSINEDWGWVEWTAVNHKLQLTTSNEELIRSRHSPNTNNSDYSIKSGYGVELNIDTNCNYKMNGTTKSVSNIKNAVCPPQYMEMFMPEFDYEEYEITSFNDLDNGYSDDNTFTLPTNPYSQFEQKCHFTPIWYPDGKYVVGVKIGQCYCPAGMLYICLDDISININGNAYDDWHIAPERN